MFKPVLGFSGLYSVSDAGEVVRHVAKWSRSERALKPAINRRGYARVKLSNGAGRLVTVSVHKLVMEAFIGPMPDGMTINHKNCDKLDNRLTNLEYCTRLENTQHAVSKGRISLSGATLSELEAAEIRRAYIPRKNSKELAARFGVTPRTIVRIANGELWRHINQRPI